MRLRSAALFCVIPVASAFQFSNPLRSLTTGRDVEALKEADNAPGGEEVGVLTGGSVYLGPPRWKTLERKLKNDEVLVPCSECMKIVDGYLSSCAKNEATFKPVVSVREYCEQTSTKDASFTDRDMDYCVNLGHKLASRVGSSFAALHTNNHAQGSCSTYQQFCHDYGGPPECYSGFCDHMADCTDCPFSVLEIDPSAPPQREVCGDRGVCLLASLPGRVGYCQCDPGFKGLACDQVKGEIVAK